MKPPFWLQYASYRSQVYPTVDTSKTLALPSDLIPAVMLPFTGTLAVQLSTISGGAAPRPPGLASLAPNHHAATPTTPMMEGSTVQAANTSSQTKLGDGGAARITTSAQQLQMSTAMPGGFTGRDRVCEEWKRRMSNERTAAKVKVTGMTRN
jgi:hypothetical protein